VEGGGEFRGTDCDFGCQRNQIQLGLYSSYEVSRRRV